MKNFSKTANNKTVGLALGSGGVRGLAHVGIIKTLVENDIPIDNIAGTSIGAWVGAHYALFQDIEKLEEYTVGKKKEKFLSMLEISFKGGVIKGRKIVQLFDEWLDGASFEDTKIPLKIIAADVITGEQVVFDSGKLAPAIRASISIPSLFEPFSYRGKTLVDGGICDPVPVDIARDMGSDIIIAVNLDNFARSDIFNKENAGSISKVSLRSIDLMKHYLSRACVADADVLIEPDNVYKELARWKNYFRHEIGDKHFRIGIEAAERKLEEIRRALK